MFLKWIKIDWWLSAIIVLSFLVNACSIPHAYYPQVTNNFKNIYDDTVNEIETTYPYFDLKLGSNGYTIWQNLAKNSETAAIQAKNDEDLFYIIAHLLYKLNDKHVYLYFPSQDFLTHVIQQYPDIVEYYKLYLLNLSANRRIDALHKIIPDMAIHLLNTAYGFVLYGANAQGVGYFYISTWVSVFSSEDITSIFQYFKNKGITKLIVDVSDNLGGSVLVAEKVMSHISPLSYSYIQEKSKTGSGENAYAPATTLSVTPTNPILQLNHIALIIDQSSASASEYFTIMLKVLHSLDAQVHLTIVGDHTTGAYGYVIRKELPNGWLLITSASKLIPLHNIHLHANGFPADQDPSGFDAEGEPNPLNYNESYITFQNLLSLSLDSFS